MSYTYDGNSRLTQASDPSGTYAFAFDNLGRLTGTTTNYSFLTGRTLTESYTYDAGSNRASLTDAEGGVTSYAYDTLNRLTTLTDFNTSAFGFSYDALGRRTQMTRRNGVSTNYSYDSLSRLLSVLHQAGASTLAGASYTVDAVGNRTSRTNQPGGPTSSYTYDAIYELTQVVQAPTTTETYTYDRVGNRLSALGGSYTYNASNQMLASPGASYGYDNNGNLASKTDGTGTTSYTWDFENRLASATLPGTGGTMTFKYDPFGRRIYASSPPHQIIYVHDGDNVIEELDQYGITIARYTQGLGIDEPLATYRSGVTSYFHADGLGSVNALTDSSGNIAATHQYDSFGNQTSSTGSAFTPFRYTARYFDGHAGLYYYRARYYDPAVGRFTTEDPIRWRGGDANFYAYVFNNPVLHHDPFGLSCACTYSISTGHFQCYGPSSDGDYYFIDTYGYSGYGVAKNDLAQTDLPGRDDPRQGGPIPMGTWTFGEGYAGRKGNPQFNLTPTRNVLIPPGRSGAKGSFAIHADSTTRPGTASEGCIVLPELLSRKKLAQCHGGRLEVMP